MFLRAAEFIFALFSLTAVLVLGEGGQQESLHQSMSVLSHISAHFEFSLLFAIAYVIGSYYIPISFISFAVVEHVWKITERNISYVNSIPYAFYGVFGVLEVARGEDGHLIWLVWGSIIGLNFYVPRLLKEDSVMTLSTG